LEPIEMTFRYGSVCSGIEAATAAWHHMGWEAAFFSEIEKFPRAVLEHHYPDVPLHGDFTTIKENEYGKIDLLVGGTPCQSFSIAGLRGGLDDDRGNLALEFCRLAQREQPRWIVWENVPGVLSSNGGRDFGSILGALEDLGYGLAYRVLDAQYFGVAQRRRRVFVVGYLGDWRPAAAVLFERHSMSGHPAPSRQARQEAAGAVATGTGGSGGDGRERPDLAGPLTAGMHKGPRGTEAVESGHVVAFQSNESHSSGVNIEVAPTLRVGSGGKSGNPPAVAFQPTADCLTAAYGTKWNGNASATNGSLFAQQQSTVRRLTPVECERLQGFPDNFTAIPWRKKGAEDCPDGPRYKALGNSMAVPVMRWIGERIRLVDDYISII
jgi:DNA (cytosine-5)-methyltransferase 1